ncbi:hypothetical protein HK098_008153 [Nowakowskiella sp. JEL0407]|nr:hypothetical protein HK098_008153 [Nowakowskiella sp. JEL0407]
MKRNIQPLTVEATKFSNGNTAEVLLHIQPPPKPKDEARIPIDLALVIDTSGPIDGTTKLEFNGKQTDVTAMGIVQQSFGAGIKALTSDDSLCVITFAETAITELRFKRMDDANKMEADTVIRNLSVRASNVPNLREGINSALRNFVEIGPETKPERRSIILVISGSSPTITPGFISDLQRRKAESKSFPTINTLSYGTAVNSEILYNLAQISNGYHAYISHPTMITTVIGNYFASLYSTFCTNVRIRIRHPRDHVCEYLSGYQIEQFDWGSIVNIGSVVYGKSRQVIIPNIYDTESDSISDPKALSIEVQFTDAKGVSERQDVQIGEFDPTKEIEIFSHVYRLKFANLLLMILRKKGRSPEVELNRLVSKIVRFQSTNGIIIEANKENRTPEGRIANILENLNGQVRLALFQYFETWGKAYLLSLLRAHLLQTCINYKDISVLAYLSDFTEFQRDRLDLIASNIPTPDRDNREYWILQFVGSNWMKIKHGGRVVRRKVEFIDEGDVVLVDEETSTFAKVVFYREIRLRGGCFLVDLDGVLLSADHPIYERGEWIRAAAKNDGDIQLYNNVRVFSMRFEMLSSEEADLFVCPTVYLGSIRCLGMPELVGR